MKLKSIAEGHWTLAPGKYPNAIIKNIPNKPKRHSPLIEPSDRDKFIKWGHDKSQAKLNEEVENFPEGPRRNEAMAALKPSKWDTVITQRGDDGVLNGVAQVWKTPDSANTEGVPKGKYIRLRNMATAKPGYGVKLLNAVKEYAMSHDAGVYLSALESSRGFYEKQGFKQAVGSTYYITAEELRAAAGQ